MAVATVRAGSLTSARITAVTPIRVRDAGRTSRAVCVVSESAVTHSPHLHLILAAILVRRREWCARIAFIGSHRMRRRYQIVLAAALALTGVVSWASTRAGVTIQTDPVDKLVSATACAVSAYHVMAGTNATMAVTNDGGWCWADTYERNNWRTLSAISAAVTNPPRHGRVLVRDIDNQEIRIAYRPEPSFGGQDSFTVHYDTDDSERTFIIAVSKPTVIATSDGRGVIPTRTSDSWAYLGRSGGYVTNTSGQAARQTKK
jgi:hypothetical protein